MNRRCDFSMKMRKGRYLYVHDVNKGPPEVIDAHHILIAPEKWFKGSHICMYALLFAIPGLIFLHLPQVNRVAAALLSFIIAGFLLRLSQGGQIIKESVIILAAFGVQLETIFRSGRTVHHFVPMSKILKPVLTECVTPFSCYWSLSLIIHGEEKLLPVFKEFNPPVKMLVPIWKALCVATAAEECTDDADSKFKTGRRDGRVV